VNRANILIEITRALNIPGYEHPQRDEILRELELRMLPEVDAIYTVEAGKVVGVSSLAATLAVAVDPSHGADRTAAVLASSSPDGVVTVESIDLGVEPTVPQPEGWFFDSRRPASELNQAIAHYFVEVRADERRSSDFVFAVCGARIRLPVTPVPDADPTLRFRWCKACAIDRAKHQALKSVDQDRRTRRLARRAGGRQW
jgi:hypothetical protein